MRNKQQKADNLSKKTEFHERLEQKQANQAEIKEGFSFLDKETYEALPLTRWLDKSGHPRTARVTCRESIRDKDSIQEGPGALRPVAALEPGPAGTLSHEH